MSDEEFVRADSRNLPKIDVFMLIKFFQKDDGFTASEISGVKVAKSMRSEYINSAVGYVKLKRKENTCTVMAQVCPEHKVNTKNYNVVVEIEEEDEEIKNAKCQDCAASAGTCKHAVAFLMWLYEKFQKPAPTEIESYWKKPKLSRISENQVLTLSDFGAESTHVEEEESVLHDFLSTCSDEKNVLLIDIYKPEASLTLHSLICTFQKNNPTQDPDPVVFINFLEMHVTKDMCQHVCNLTVNQSSCPLWYELRYGRITASIIHAVSRAKNNKSLISGMLGQTKVPITKAITRGRNLEKEVLLILGKTLNIKFRNAGFLISHEYPLFGASPDGISDMFVVEIKCPSSRKTYSKYLSASGEIGAKFKAQLLLQMFIFSKQKGIFCVADPEFEKNKRIEFIIVRSRPNFVKKMMNKSLKYWKENVFSQLFK